MNPKDKALHDMATPFVDSHEEAQELLDTVTMFIQTMLKDEEEMTPALHWHLCGALAEYLHYLEHYPLYEIRAGYIVKEQGEYNHLWLELPNNEILDPLSGMINDQARKMPAVYIGIKPEWYE